MSDVLLSSTVPTRAIFAEIAQVAATERMQLFAELEDSPEVQVLRTEASKQAQRIVAEAYTDAARVRDEARAEGYAEGYASGERAARTDEHERSERFRADLRAGLVALVEQIDDERRRIWLDAEHQILAFVLELARKVVKDDAEVNREVAVSVVRNALRRVVDTESIRIRVNISDLEAVRDAKADLITTIDGVRHLEVIEDRRVAAGGAVVETNSGTIDARIETQFDEIAATLKAIARQAA